MWLPCPFLDAVEKESRKMNDPLHSLLEKLKARLARGNSTDFDPPDEPRSPIPSDVITDAERELGFDIPRLLRTLYREMGTEFGPGYGLLPLVTLHRLQPKDVAMQQGM